ncbi:MAG TPA: hypothetical protein VKP30_19270 [Polyangiaceae bacterium]|nr:hypothetical protein [Polyangiaceae bacterium]
MNTNRHVAHFDGIADKWDSFNDPAIVIPKLEEGLKALDVLATETVLDVGCGTGNLTRALLARLSDGGRVHPR